LCVPGSTNSRKAGKAHRPLIARAEGRKLLFAGVLLHLQRWVR
jgi:hypothetical protein